MSIDIQNQGTYGEYFPVRQFPVDREAEMERGQDKAEHIEGQIIEAMRAMPCRNGVSFKEYYDVSAVSVEYAWQTNPDRYLPSATSMYIQLCETDISSDTDANDILNCQILAAIRLVDDLKKLKAWMKQQDKN